jgi:hypothetical protein
MADFVPVSELLAGEAVTFYNPVTRRSVEVPKDRAGRFLDEAFFGRSTNGSAVSNWFVEGTKEEALFLGDGWTWFRLVTRKPGDTHVSMDAAGKLRGTPKLDWVACYDALRELGVETFESYMLKSTSYKRFKELLPTLGVEVLEDEEGTEFHEVLVSLSA